MRHWLQSVMQHQIVVESGARRPGKRSDHVKRSVKVSLTDKEQELCQKLSFQVQCFLRRTPSRQLQRSGRLTDRHRNASPSGTGAAREPVMRVPLKLSGSHCCFHKPRALEPSSKAASGRFFCIERRDSGDRYDIGNSDKHG